MRVYVSSPLISSPLVECIVGFMRAAPSQTNVAAPTRIMMRMILILYGKHTMQTHGLSRLLGEKYRYHATTTSRNKARGLIECFESPESNIDAGRIHFTTCYRGHSQT